MAERNPLNHSRHPFSIQRFDWPHPAATSICGSPGFQDFYWVGLGIGRQLSDDRSEPVRPGDLLAVPGDNSAVEVDRGFSGYKIQVTAEALKEFESDSLFAALRPFLQYLENRILHLHFAAADRCEIEWLLSQMMRAEDQHDEEISLTLLRLLFGQFLLGCYRNWQTGSREFKGISRNGEDVIRVLQRYIDDHLSESFGLAQLAQKAGYAPSYLSSLFTKATGQGLTEYICESRITRAQELLSRTNLQVNQVCYDIGFRDLAHFNRTFKKMVGVTPRQYRHMHNPETAEVDVPIGIAKFAD